MTPRVTAPVTLREQRAPTAPRSGDARWLGFGVTAGAGATILEPLAREVARLGYDSFWTNDSARAGADGLDDLALVHRAAPGLGLGVGVVPLDRRPADRIAADIARLGLPVDALRLGVGSGSEQARPLAVVREGVAALRALLPTARILVAALGPRMCEFAGEIGDGVLLNWAVPARLRWATERVAAGATRSGRGLDDVEVWSYVRAAVGADAKARLAAEAERYAAFPAYGRQFAAMGARFEDVGVAGDDLPRQLDPYRSAVDGVVVRALPHAVTLDALVAIARAAVSSAAVSSAEAGRAAGPEPL